MAQQNKAVVSRQRGPYKLRGPLEDRVIESLRKRFSPEQISGVMALEEGHKVISHEAIYIYRRQTFGDEELNFYLRIRHRKRYKKRGIVQIRGQIPHRVGIEERPTIVETNTQISHWAVRRSYLWFWLNVTGKVQLLTQEPDAGGQYRPSAAQTPP